MSDDITVKLLRFGTIKVNKKVKAHKSKGFWYVWFGGGYHGVPEEDVEGV